MSFVSLRSQSLGYIFKQFLFISLYKRRKCFLLHGNIFIFAVTDQTLLLNYLTMKNESKPPKKGDRWFEILKLTITFILTTVAGGTLLSYYKKAEIDHQNNTILIESEKAKAEKCFEEISVLIDTRIYKMRRILWAFASNKNEQQIQKLWDDYSDFLYIWNSNINRNKALLHRYFGEDKKLEFIKIHTQFINLGDLLEKLKKGHIKNTLSIQDKLDTLSEQLYDFDESMLEQIEIEQVGIFKNKKNSNL